MKLNLVVLSEGKAKGQAIAITLPQFLIGRDPQCQLRPANPVISKRHCAILIKNGKAFIRDFGSTNGTFVNDEPVKGERQLHNEDTLKVGPLLFRVALEATPPVNKPTPPPPKASAPTDDDSVAAMLLSLQDEGGASPPGEVDADGVPSGSTIHEMMSPLPPEEEKPKEPEGKEAKKDAPKGGSGDTAKAAAALLEKYTRRPRA
ncbi:MAG: FHA domain-containing protein [Gemmataceae bacterium]|nr:FHA domain-containing protein [Gemmataceae bacterium]